MTPVRRPRRRDQLRPIIIQRGFTRAAQGSVLFQAGRTKVLCTASVTDEVPAWLQGQGRGWVTAEYAMLPASTWPRKPRERGARLDGRSQEIQRLVGRALRAVVDLQALAGRTIFIDCDVLEADGGTRTASISGALVALVDAVRWMQTQGLVSQPVLLDSVAAVSAGLVDGKPTLDLDYAQDAAAEVDLNVVMTGRGRFVEIQGTAEKRPFDDRQLAALLRLARRGIAQITRLQAAALADAWPF